MNTFQKSVTFLLSILLSVFTLFSATSQEINKSATLKYKRLYIGDKLPDIVFKDMINYPKKNARVSDFKGKLLILDFWSTGCSSCIKAFPKMEKLQKEFEDKLQVVLINPFETTAQINKEFQRIKKYSPNANVYIPALPGVNKDEDSSWLKFFPMFSIPTHVWIDATGKVIAITQGYNATSEHVQAVWEGKMPNMVLKDDIAGRELFDKGYLQPLVPSLPAIYYSAFAPYYSAGFSGGGNEDKIKGTFKMTFCNRSPIELFKTAFSEYTNSGRRVIVEVTNKEQYEEPVDGNLIDDWSREYLFTYEVQMPIKDKQIWQSIMQQDVNRFFGPLFNIEAKIEKRPYKDEGMVDVLVIKDKR